MHVCIYISCITMKVFFCDRLGGDLSLQSVNAFETELNHHARL